MQIKSKDSKRNFKLVQETKLKDLKSKLIEYRHKSGAQIFWLKNKDKEKFFGLSLISRPYDDMGLPHITEHSVLHGSKKYPFFGADPFYLLLRRKQALQLNATTYPEQTFYYFSALNHGDFLSTMDIYLDGIFNPNILWEENILRQEGKRYDQNSKGELVYNGVVLQEMMSYYGNPDVTLENMILKSMLKDGAYKFDSGGDPNKIVDLSFEDFKTFYKKYYGTKNTKIFLYGDIKEADVFGLLDEYLSSARNSRSFKVTQGKEAGKKNVKQYFNLPKDESRLALVYYAEQAERLKDNIILEIIFDSLSRFESDFLKSYLKKSGLSRDVNFYFEADTSVNLMHIHFDGINAEKFKEAQDLVRKSIKQIARDGLNKKRIKDEIENAKYRIKKWPLLESKAKSIFRHTLSLWNYINPAEALNSSGLLKEIEEDFKKDEKIFDAYFRKYFLEAEDYGVFKLEAKESFDNLKEFKAKQAALKKLSKARKREIEKQIEDFKNFKKQKDDLSLISSSSFKDLKAGKRETFNIEKKVSAGGRSYLCKNKSGIYKLDLYFNLSHLTLKELRRLQVLLKLFKKASSKGRSRQEIDRLKSSLQSFDFNLALLPNRKKESEVKLHFQAETWAKKSTEIFALLEIYTQELLFDENILTKSLKEMLSRIQTQIQDWRTHISFTDKLALSKLSKSHYIQEQISGYAFIDFLKSELTKDPAELITYYKELYKKVFTKKAIFIAEFSPKEMAVQNLDFLDSRVYKKVNIDFEKSYESSFLKNNFLPANQNAMSFEAAADFYKMLLAQNLLSFGYLTDEVRVKRGAYGVYFMPIYPGLAHFRSFNDPNVSSSFEIFEKAFCEAEFDEADFQGAIARVLLYFDRPQSETEAAHKALIMDFKGENEDFLEKKREEILSTTRSDIEKLFARLAKDLKKGNVKLSIGAELKKEDAKLFDKIDEA